jgi:AcrR family transcriptional regulator
MTIASSLGREDWLRAARLALHRGGPDAVRVEPLAVALGVTKGSFYWHFADRTTLLEALITEWEEERDVVAAELSSLNGPHALRELIGVIGPRVAASVDGDAPSDAAMFAWAATDSSVARRVNAAEAARVALIQRIVGDEDVGEFLYLAYLGFLMRRRRVPSTDRFFPTLARLAEQIVSLSRRRTRAAKRERVSQQKRRA